MTIIFVDVETTGLNTELHDIISIGAVLLADQTTTYAKDFSIWPSDVDAVSPQALAINGRSSESLVDSDLDCIGADALQPFVAWVKRQYRRPILAGWNVHFDARFLKKYLNPFPFGYMYLDVAALAIARYQKVQSADKISSELGIPPEAKPHIALNGARHAVSIYNALTAKEG